MASSTKMTMTLTYAESQLIADALKSARHSSVHSARYRMNRIQKDLQMAWMDIPKPPASSLDYSVPLYYEWEEFYEEIKKIGIYNTLLTEFGFNTDFPVPEDFVPRVEEEPSEEVKEEVEADA